MGPEENKEELERKALMVGISDPNDLILQWGYGPGRIQLPEKSVGTYSRKCIYPGKSYNLG